MLRTLTDRLKQVQDDTDILVAAGANELEIAIQWQQQTQVGIAADTSCFWVTAASPAAFVNDCMQCPAAAAGGILLPLHGVSAGFGVLIQHSALGSFMAYNSKQQGMSVRQFSPQQPARLPMVLDSRHPVFTSTLQEPLVSYASVCWAAAVLLGRSFQLDMSEPDMQLEADMSYYGSWQPHGPSVLALVPWADMLRHSSEAGER